MWRASVEVRGSIVFATLLVILVFVPLFALSGIEGRLFAPLGVAYIVSILSSLLVSVTVTPALCSLLLPRARATGHTRDGFLVRGLKRAQRWVLGHTLRHPFAVLGGALVLVTAAVGAVPLFGSEFLPTFNEGTATINVLARPGTSLETSNALGAAAEKLLLGVPEVKSVGRRTGRAEEDEHAEGVHYSEIDVDFHSEQDDGAERPRAEVLADIRERLALLPGVVVNLGQPISHRLDHLLSGVRAQIAVKVFGADLGALRSAAAAIEQVAKQVPGLVDVQVEQQVLIPQVQLRILPERAARYGFTTGALAARLEQLLAGKISGLVIEGDKSFRVRLVLGDAARADVESISRAWVDTPSGARAPLEALAEVRLEHGPNAIVHERGERRIVISANVQERDLGSAVQELEARVAALPASVIGKDLHVAFEGQFQSQAAATELIAWLALLSLAGMVLVLWLHFGRVALVAQVLLNIPLALIGSVAALGIAGLPFSVATLVGFITLCGIASRNSILLIDHYLSLAREGMPFTPALIVRGSTERLVPVLMTALTAGLGLIPLVLSADAPGKEILHPVAVVILGGLISSTLLDLLVTPAAFWLYGGRAATRAEASDPFEVVPVVSESSHA